MPAMPSGKFEFRPYDRWAAYGQPKTADVLLAVEAGRRWAVDGISANAVNPGFINTGLQRHVDNDTCALGAMNEERTLLGDEYYKTPVQDASTSVLLAASPLVAGATGRYFEDNLVPPDIPPGRRERSRRG